MPPLIVAGAVVAGGYALLRWGFREVARINQELDDARRQLPEAVFREVARVSEPGGRFVVFTPNRFNYAMVVAALTPYRFHLFWKKLTYFVARGEWRDFEEELFPTFYRANSKADLRRLLQRASFQERRLEYLGLAHSFGFIRPLYALSLLFERAIDRFGLHTLKADLLAVFEREGSPADESAFRQKRSAASGR